MAEIELGGVRLALALEDGPGSAYLRGLLAAHRVVGGANATVTVHTGRVPLPSGTEVWRHERLHVIEAEDEWWLGGAELTARVSGDRLEMFEPPREQSDGWDRATASAALLLLLRTRGLFALHAAAVEWRGHSVLCAGASGVGKSTLAVLMALDGGELRSDDMTLIDVAGNVHALAQTVRLDPRSVCAHPERAPAGAAAGVKTDLTSLHPLGGTMSAEVLLFPTRVSQGGLRAEPLAPAHAVARLLEASPFALQRGLGRVGDHLGALSALANRCVSFRLEAGPNLLDDPATELAALPFL